MSSEQPGPEQPDQPHKQNKPGLPAKTKLWQRRVRLWSFTLVITTLALAIGSWIMMHDYVAAEPEKLRLPPGFKIAIYANVPNARQLCLGPKGTLFVGSRDNPGIVSAIKTNIDGSGKPGPAIKIDGDLLMPNGVAMKGNDLYVAEVYRVRKYPDIETHLDHPPKPIVVNDTFPHDLHHGWKYIKFGPDGMLYVPIGAPCNACIQKDLRFAGMMRMKSDGTGLESFARGIRNTVGFDWDPGTKDLWFTDNGRDWLGDNLPPDELNHAPQKGLNFGFPYRYGQNVVDPEYGAKAPAGMQFTPAAQDLDAHVAALGMVFYTGKMFPPEYQNQIFICEHGSWNRSTKSGYRVTMVTLKDGKPVKYQPFIEGWLSDHGVSGRPVDLLVMPDGSLLISDDKGGAIYSVTYKKP